MSYYLRVEAVNLSHFINDTNDLSTTRGGSLLLLEAMEKVEDIIIENSPKKLTPEEQDLINLTQQLNDLNNTHELTKSEKNKKKNLRSKIKKLKVTIKEHDQDSTPTITKGASWGLFDLDVPHKVASKIQENIITFFKNDSLYQQATFVVNLHLNNGDLHYQEDRDRIQTLNHWQQLQAPSMSICKEGISSCTLNKVRPAHKKHWLKEEEHEYVSESVYLRREYGRDQKQKFYRKITKTTTAFTQDLKTLSQSDNKGILDGKIAYLYIDGNSFGKAQRASINAIEQTKFDESTRQGREQLLSNILEKIEQNPGGWLTDNKIRLETLLWGGDEITWVVPAWQGWWMINEFYKQAQQHIKHNDQPLFHGAGLVYCHHNAPLHRIDSLARTLADQFAKSDRGKNLIAYQVLESFDHLSTSPEHFRNNRAAGLGQSEQLLIAAENIDTIVDSVNALKSNEEFARRKIYQIMQAYKAGDINKAEQYLTKLPDSCKTEINHLKQIFGGENSHWLHLIDLWDYVN